MNELSDAVALDELLDRLDDVTAIAPMPGEDDLFRFLMEVSDLLLATGRRPRFARGGGAQ